MAPSFEGAGKRARNGCRKVAKKPAPGRPAGAGKVALVQFPARLVPGRRGRSGAREPIETHVWLRGPPRYRNARSVNALPRQRAPSVERAARAATRAGYTHVAMICDDVALQPFLPQVIIVGKRFLTVERHTGLLTQMPPNLFLLRHEKGWNDSRILSLRVKIMAETLAAAAPGRPAILSMDAARLHLAPAVLQACRRHGMHVLLVPAQTRWLLQPCDRRLFSLYKDEVAEVMQHRAAGAEDGVFGLQDSDAEKRRRRLRAGCKWSLRLRIYRRCWRCAGCVMWKPLLQLQSGTKAMTAGAVCPESLMARRGERLRGTASPFRFGSGAAPARAVAAGRLMSTVFQNVACRDCGEVERVIAREGVGSGCRLVPSHVHVRELPVNADRRAARSCRLSTRTLRGLSS